MSYMARLALVLSMCMSYPPIPRHHVDLPQPSTLKRKIDVAFSDGEMSLDSTGDDRGPELPDISRFIDDEFSLEVAIRERLATAIEGRIQWALHMLDALSNVNEFQDQQLDGDDFQDAALDALDALEAPSSFLFDDGYPEERSPSPSPIAPNPPAPQRVPKTRSSRTPKPSQPKKHLYIKLPSGTTENQVAILMCPTCGRTQFTTLQGLLNHARLAHGAEWASHDACIIACASPISTDTLGWETHERDGVEVPWGGSVAGLRRLFERAVGVDGVLPNLLSAHSSLDIPEGSETTPSTLLSRTLGLHADSAALAQFLGRAPKRRCIHTYGEDREVDILTLDDTGSLPGQVPSGESISPKKGFSMRYPHRNIARKDFDIQVDVGKEAEIAHLDDTRTPTIVAAGTTASRFHITARIRLEDRSLFLKDDRRAQLGTTDQYRWMLGVTAPSYSLPLSSFLTCVTVIPPRTVSPVFLTVQQQPFAVIGTANEPFMAKIVFEWVGGGKMEVEHWVELDQSKTSTSVFGSEQLLDVELDRNASLLPIQGSSPPLPSLDRSLPSDSSLRDKPQVDEEYGCTLPTKEENYEQVLRNLLPKVPMTMKDVKSRSTVQVSYRLVANPAQLLALVPGRRKAIEWARARALHSLYMDHMTSVPSSRRTVLSVGDVYTFLEDTLYFPRPTHPTSGSAPEAKKKRKENEGTPILGEESCSTCGIKKRLHPGFSIVKSDEETGSRICDVVPMAEQRYGMELPLINLAKVFAWPDGLEQAVRGPLSPLNPLPIQALKTLLPPCQHTPRDLVMHNPPELILAVHKIVSKPHLSTFPTLASRGEMSIFLAKREEAERRLAPAAILTATLRPLISTLFQSAIEVAKKDVTSIVPATKDGRGKRMKKLTFVLTPGHILRGLRLRPSNGLKSLSNVGRTSASPDHRVREATALCLSRLGVRLDFAKNAPARVERADSESTNIAR